MASDICNLGERSLISAQLDFDVNLGIIELELDFNPNNTPEQTPFLGNAPEELKNLLESLDFQ